MTFTQLIEETRAETRSNRELLEERVVAQEQVFELQDQIAEVDAVIHRIESELIRRGHTI